MRWNEIVGNNSGRTFEIRFSRICVKACLTAALLLRLDLIITAKCDGIPELFYSFDASVGGHALIAGKDGAFYGTTTRGGTYGLGTVYRLETNGNFTTLLSFDGTNGSSPAASLLQATDGFLYGTTPAGGGKNVGTVFRLAMTGQIETLVQFAYTNGASPEAELIQARDGMFYGTTTEGGRGLRGTVFRVAPDGKLSTIASFEGAHGSRPRAALVQGRELNFLYGTTFSGGSSNLGTIFLCTTDGSLVTLASFVRTNGANPVSELVQAKDGRLYGVTKFGGSHGRGTVYSIALDGDLRTVHSFTGRTNGGVPISGLTEGSNGELYGTTPYNMDAGLSALVYRINPDGQFVNSATFPYALLNPSTRLLAAGDGYLYGVSHAYGGSKGAVYRILISPKLEFQVLGPNLRLSWPIYPQGFHLQQASRLEGSLRWSFAAAHTITNDKRIQALVPLGPDKAFFRLAPR